jgi:RNA polymerase sigma-70 factor, ECF subfamily
MTPSGNTDALLVDQVRAGQAEAWNELIARYEGRLLAFVHSRTRSRESAEDVVQETFVGFLTSLPNYDARRSLENYLFSIAAHKLTDQLRREGRRPTLPLVSGSDRSSSWEPPGTARPASSIVRSAERRGLEENALAAALARQIAEWQRRDDWQKLQCAELLFVRGWPNKEVARRLKISEQAVANHKFELIAKLRLAVRGQGLPEDVFPELAEAEK